MAKSFRTCLGKLLFLARRRPDVQYDVKELARHGNNVTMQAVQGLSAWFGSC